MRTLLLALWIRATSVPDMCLTRALDQLTREPGYLGFRACEKEDRWYLHALFFRVTGPLLSYVPKDDLPKGAALGGFDGIALDYDDTRHARPVRKRVIVCGAVIQVVVVIWWSLARWARPVTPKKGDV